MREFTLTLTEDEMMLIRHALCRKSTETLVKAHETKDELKRLGRTDTYLYDMEMAEHNTYRDMIDRIDKVMD